MTLFQKRVYETVKKIPQGKVMTYTQVAKKSGSKRAFRAVGNILNKNKDLNIPCHRVVRSNGKIGGYNLGQKKKASLLRKEGFLIKKGRIISLPFQSIS
ncbi:MAG TPA: MGMT family protein [Candidatus Parcubacteria bacterium]|jgi:methylated-DNA-[protein]-cysteine S-methyltransferase|nr:MGMT family protein [Candidatus Parcubacteria bacterium]|tara:strand:- start:1870 stop:2166 length:297 start_codon:yes stop_codon:yes gene_type:complete